MDSADEKQEPPTSKWRRLKWTIVAICSLLDMASVLALGPSVLALQEQILQDTTNCEGSSCAAQLVKYTGPSATFKACMGFILATPYGNLADRFGRRPLFIVSIFGSFLSLPFLIGKPKSILPFLIMDAAGALLPDEKQIIFTMLADLSDPDTRASNYARMMAATFFIAVLGSLVGSALVASHGPTVLVIGSLTLSTVQLTAVIFLLPETRPTKTETETDTRRRSSLTQVLIGEKNASLVARWQRSFFWLYIVSGLPSGTMASVLNVFLQDRFGYTPAELGLYMSLMGVASFFWLLVGFKLLSKICPNKGRIYQVIKTNFLVTNIIQLCINKHWIPFALAFPNGTVMLEGVLLKGILLEVTDQSELGWMNGILTTADALMGIIEPTLGATLFSTAHALGLMYAPWLFFLCGPVPIQIVISSFTLLPENMPPSLQAKLAGPSTQEGTSERLLSTEGNQQPAADASQMSPEAWERKHPPLGMGVKCAAPVLFLFSVMFIAGNEQAFACRDRFFYEAKAAVSVIAGSDLYEMDGELVFFRGDLERGSSSIINQTLRDLGPYFAFPPDLESPSLAVSVEVMQCHATGDESAYDVKWDSKYIDSSKFHRNPRTGLFETVCGAENYWNPLLPHPGSYDADEGKVGAFTILWAHGFTKEIALNALVVNRSMLTDQARKESFYAGPQKCGPGFSYCQDWKGNQTPNNIGEARISMKVFDWNTPTMTILGNNTGGSISPWTAPNGWLCDNFGRSYAGMVKTGSHSVDELLIELKHGGATIRTWILRILGFALAGLMFSLVARPLQIHDDCMAFIFPCSLHLLLPKTMATQSLIGVSCLLSLGQCLLVSGCVWVVTWPFMGSSLIFIAGCISFYFLYIHRKHRILIKAGARTSNQAGTSKGFQNSGHL